MSDAVVLRGGKLWLYDAKTRRITDPLTGKTRQRRDLDTILSPEDIVRMWTEDLDGIRRAFNRPLRGTRYVDDLKSAARDAEDTRAALEDLRGSWVVTSSWGTRLVSDECLADYIKDIRDENGREPIRIEPLTGWTRKGLESDWA